MKIDSYTKDIATAIAPETLEPDDGHTNAWKFAREIWIYCPSGNTSDLTIGSKESQVWIVAQGESQRLSAVNRAGQSGRFNLKDIWVKAGTDGDDVTIMLIDPELN